MHRQRNQSASRKAASAVEFAVVLPVIVLLLLGAVEMGRAVMVQHSLQEAAQAGCRVYAVFDAPEEAAEDIIGNAMSKAGVKKYSVTFDPPEKSKIKKNMEPVTVTVSVDYSDVAWLSPDFMSGAAVVARCTIPADLENSKGKTK